MTVMKAQVVLGGFGGQGIILAGFILGQAAAIYEGQNATFTQDYGPEARGGACRAQVVISDVRISYPYVDCPSVMVIMSQEAYTRYVGALAPDANPPVLIDTDMVKPNINSRPVYGVPATRIARELGRPGIANIVMLGFLTAVASVASADAVKKSIRDSVPKGTEELNLKAFERGYACGLEAAKAN